MSALTRKEAEVIARAEKRSVVFGADDAPVPRRAYPFHVGEYVNTPRGNGFVNGLGYENCSVLLDGEPLCNWRGDETRMWFLWEYIEPERTTL